MAKQIADVYKINTSLEQMLGGWLLSAYVIIDTAEKEAAFTDFLAGLPAAGPQETAEMIMAFALSFDGEPRDDMTVLVGGIYGR